MKKVTTLVMLLCFCAMFQAHAQLSIDLPQSSPEATLKQKIGLTDVSIKYSRPGIKGRKIFGGIIQYGKVWRTGANMSTIIEFSDKVSIGGKDIPKGKYSLYTIPGKKEWTIIINKGITWGTQYNEKKNLVTFKVAPVKTKYTFESFTIDFSDFTLNSAKMNILWENTAVSFQVKTEVDTKIMAKINRYMEKPERALTNVYYQSARYYFDTNRDMNKALGWINKAVELYPAGYWMVHLKAKIQGKLKDYKGAIATAKIGIEKAKKGGNPDYVRLNKEAINKWEKTLNK